MKNFVGIVVLTLSMRSHVTLGVSNSWIFKNPEVKATQITSDEPDPSIASLGYYPITSKIEKVKYENETFEDIAVCNQKYKIQVYAKNYGANELPWTVKIKYKAFRQKIKHKLEALSHITNYLPTRGSCEFNLNGVPSNAYPVAVVYYDIQDNKIQGRIFTGFQTDPLWQISVSTGTKLQSAQLLNLKGLVLSQIAAPAISENSRSWSYHGATPGNFQEIAVSDYQFLH
jgi:hypothetical protein